MKANPTSDFVSDYLRSLDTELENIDKRMRLMMGSVDAHSQKVRNKALEDSFKSRTNHNSQCPSPKVSKQSKVCPSGPSLKRQARPLASIRRPATTITNLSGNKGSSNTQEPNVMSSPIKANSYFAMKARTSSKKSNGTSSTRKINSNSLTKKVSESLLASTLASRQRALQRTTVTKKSNPHDKSPEQKPKKKTVLNEEQIKKAAIMYARELERLRRLDEKRQLIHDSREELELLNCSFHPQINRMSATSDLAS